MGVKSPKKGQNCGFLVGASPVGARLGRLQRLRALKLAARPPSWRTNWRAPTLFAENDYVTGYGATPSLSCGCVNYRRMRAER